MSNASDFIIKRSILIKYVGPGGDVVIPDGVTSIGYEAFCECSNLTNITIPDSVTTIEGYAFYGCKCLASIIIGNGVANIGNYAFQNCTGLTDITIPDCVTDIGTYAFSGCKSLAKVTIGNGVSRIGWGAFNGCTDLTNIVIPNSVTSIGTNAFAGCKSLKGIVIPDSVASIGKQAFNDCAPDLSIDISNPAMLAPEYRYAAVVCFAEENTAADDPRCAAFYKLIKSNAEKWMKQAINNPALIMLMCREKLIAAKLAPEYLKAAQATGDAECIARLVEYNANTLTAGEKKRVATQKEKSEAAVIERKIARQKKASIKGLTFVFVGSPETFKGQSEWKAFVTKKGGKVVAAVSSKVDYLILADPSSNSEQKKKAEKLNIDIITEGQFNDLAGRSFDINKKNVLVKYWGGGGNVVIPEGVTSIGLRAFEQCKSVQSVIIPEGVTNIGKNAFWGCRELSSVSIPDSVTKIAAGAFDYCDKLRYYIYDSAKYLGNETNPFMVLIEATSRQIESCDVHNDTRLIYEGAFYGCSKLTTLTLPNSVIGIAEDPAVLNKEDLVIHCGEKGFSLLPKEVRNRLAALWEKDPDIFGEEQVKAILKYLKRTVKTETKEKAPRAKKVPTTDWKQDYRWIIGEDGAIITKYKGTEANVTIPSEIEGSAVVWIDKNAFKGNEHICSVKIPSTVTTIAENAFAYCKKLKTVEWGEGLRTIEKRAFYGSFCEEKVIYLPEGLETIGVNAFANPNETETYPPSFKEEIHLPASIKVFKNFLGELRDYDCNDAHVYFNGTETKIENKDFPYEMVVLHVPKGSKTEKYAKKTNLPVIAE